MTETKFAFACSGWNIRVVEEDTALEALWKNLPDAVAEAGNVLCVVDGSGSMLCPVGTGTTTALHVSKALGIYFAERMRGAYHNRFIPASNEENSHVYKGIFDALIL